MIETRVEVWENEKFMSWALEPKASVNKTFSSSPNHMSVNVSNTR